MSDDELRPSEDNPLRGVQILMERLEALAPSDVVRKGAQLSAFFKEDRYRRRQGERLAEWVSRWDEGLDKLRADGGGLRGDGPPVRLVVFAARCSVRGQDRDGPSQRAA